MKYKIIKKINISKKITKEITTSKKSLTKMQVIMSSFYSSQLLLKVSNSFLPERQIQEVFY
jgi:hypothetical protein